MDISKQQLRQLSAKSVAALSATERTEKNRAILNRLLAASEYRNAKVVVAYDSDASETSTQQLLADVLADGKTLGLLRTRKKDRTVEVHRVANLQQDLEPSRFGFREPKESLPKIAVEDIDLLVVPGVAFDLEGHRLGRGAGYYDRFLALPALNATVCALAYDCQVVTNVPVMPHDCPVDLIVTESRRIEVRVA